jgi:hypothetical protein
VSNRDSSFLFNGSRVYFPGVGWPEPKVKLLPLLNAEVKNE